MIRLPAFEYLAPRTVGDAVKCLADRGAEAMLVAGGTDLFPNMKRGQFEPKTLIGLRGIRELSGVSGGARLGVVIGAATTLSAVAAHAEIAGHYPALATAAGRLERSDAKSKVVILLTDGQNNAGNIPPLTAADAAKALGIKVYTIGAGTRGLAPFPVRDFFGNLVYQPTKVDVDEDTLKKIAEKTNGTYFRATDTASLQKIYADIDRMERSTFVAPRYLDYDELYPWLAFPALALLMLEAGLSHTRLRKLP